MGTPTLSNRTEQAARLVLVHSSLERAVALLRRLSSARYDIVSCPRSVLGEDWLRGQEPDLVLLDPPTDEQELLATCEVARSQTERPIVVLSERNDERIVAHALATGIDEYLCEPIGDQELAARIDAMLRRIDRYTGPGESQRVGGLVLSYADHSVELAERTVSLSPMEFRLLACLASAPGRVLTHQTLMSRVWGAEYVDSRHYLRVYIRYLREKLEDDPTQPQLIVSEWGVGYRLESSELPARRQEAPPHR